MKTYFVTGATGAVGSAVVARLLADPQVSVVALVRAGSSAEAAARLDGALASLGVRERSSAASGRLRVVPGNMEQRHLGLSEADYRSLATSCTHLIHCAGAVRMNLPLDAARQAAVGAARHILELAQSLADSGRLAKVELVSTVGVAGRKYRLLREEWVGADHQFHNTYEQAKAEAEQLARDAVSTGLPLTLHRPSMVVGHSQPGHALHFQVFYFLVEFLSGRRTRGLFPELRDARLDTVPVDFVAEAIVRSSESQVTAGRILHLCAGPRGAIPLSRLQRLVREQLMRFGERTPEPRYIPRGLFRAVTRGLGILAHGRSRAALATLPLFLDYLDANQSFDNTRSMAWLDQERISLPRAEEYLPRILEFYFTATRRKRKEEA